MPSSNRTSSSESRILVILLLVVIGGFLAFCGLGQSDSLVTALGVVVAVGGPILLTVLNSRNKVRLYVKGNALVDDVTPRPGHDAPTARGRLKLTINAPGIRNVSVSGIDQAIPLDKWPEPGATLPVQVLKGNPRKFTVLWDSVQSYTELARSEDATLLAPALATQSGNLAYEPDSYTLDGDDFGPASGDAYGHLNLPPDDTPTLTNLPPIDAGIEEAPEPAPAAVLTAEPAAAAAATKATAGEGVIAAEDEPIIVRLRSTPRQGSTPHRRPSPHPRTGAHDRVRRSRPARPNPDDEPAETAAEPIAAPPAEDYAIPEAGAAEAPAAVEAAPEVEWWNQPEESAPKAFYPDREDPDRENPDRENAARENAARESPDRGNPDRENLDRETEPVPAVREEPEEDPKPTGSAWSVNGHGPVPVGAGLYSAPPVRRLPPPFTDAGEDDGEATPDPYATEHYIEPGLTPADEPDEADELEEQPLPEGAVAEFLAAAPRRQAMPLDGVNGVSITLIVSDLQRSRRFYRDTLGLSELDSGPTSAVLETGSARVVLRRVADMPPVDRRVVHLNLDVPDVYEAYERLREQGVDFVHRPRTVPQGEQLDLCSATFRDPDGHAIALTRWELRR